MNGRGVVDGKEVGDGLGLVGRPIQPVRCGHIPVVHGVVCDNVKRIIGVYWLAIGYDFQRKSLFRHPTSPTHTLRPMNTIAKKMDKVSLVRLISLSLPTVREATGRVRKPIDQTDDDHRTEECQNSRTAVVTPPPVARPSMGLPVRPSRTHPRRRRSWVIDGLVDAEAGTESPDIDFL